MPFKAYEALGLGIPFMLATATYGLFYWLDKNASAQATRAISAWFRGQAYAKIDLSAAIVGAFDKLYKSPLLSFRAFRRSIAVSIVVYSSSSFLLFMMAPSWRARFSQPFLSYTDWAGILLLAVLCFILIDYISLFVVRKCLTIAEHYLMLSLIIAFIAGLFIFLLLYSVMAFIIMIFTAFNHNFLFFFLSYGIPSYFRNLFYFYLNDPEKLAYLSPMFLVHLWLLLFALGALGTRLLYPIFRIITWAQWFLKQGDRHPMRAIGMVAAALMFIAGGIWKAAAAV
jgi:hypothetical protein